MTATQKLLGGILKKRIVEQLALLADQRDFTTIQETMDIFLAGDKITIDQYTELETLILSA